MAKKHFVKIVAGLLTVKMTLGYGYTLNLQKENIVLSLIKIDTLNFTMYFFKDFDMPFKNIRHWII